jgi:1-deoxy-D-xylulose-5-phosphate synthase
MRIVPLGRAELRRPGRGVALLAFGSMLAPALAAAEALNATVVNMRFVKPLDEEMILRLAKTHELLVTIEENTVAGGAGSGVAELLHARDIPTRMLHLGLPDVHVSHGRHEQLLAELGLDAEGIRRAVRNAVRRPLARAGGVTYS